MVRGVLLLCVGYLSVLVSSNSRFVVVLISVVVGRGC